MKLKDMWDNPLKLRLDARKTTRPPRTKWEKIAVILKDSSRVR
jgi:hypothetical protein